MRALGWTRKIVLASAGAVVGIAIGVAGAASAQERDPRDAPAPDKVAEAVKKFWSSTKREKSPPRATRSPTSPNA
jgi:hypothetical protein